MIACPHCDVENGEERFLCWKCRKRIKSKTKRRQRMVTPSDFERWQKQHDWLKENR